MADAWNAKFPTAISAVHTVPTNVVSAKTHMTYSLTEYARRVVTSLIVSLAVEAIPLDAVSVKAKNFCTTASAKTAKSTTAPLVATTTLTNAVAV